MLTQISLMPTSRRCFGNPSSIVPSKAVCTKHRVLCTQQTRPSRGTLIPSAAARSRGLPFTDLRNGHGPSRSPRFGVGSQAKSLHDGYRELHSRGGREVCISPSWTSRRARRVAANTRACIVLFASALFARVARSNERDDLQSASDRIGID